MNERTKIKNVMKKVVPDGMSVACVGWLNRTEYIQTKPKQFTLATEVTAMAVYKVGRNSQRWRSHRHSDQFKIPVKYIGLGEGMEDLQVFRKKNLLIHCSGECMKRKTIDIITLGCSKTGWIRNI